MLSPPPRFLATPLAIAAGPRASTTIGTGGPAGARARASERPSGHRRVAVVALSAGQSTASVTRDVRPCADARTTPAAAGTSGRHREQRRYAHSAFRRRRRRRPRNSVGQYTHVLLL